MMDLKKLFSVQKVLRDRINYQESDRFDKLILALLVEVGECANEWRGFKFWSKDQEPRVRVPSTAWGEPYKNLLLEEYVDGFTFIIELGLEIGLDDFKPTKLMSFRCNANEEDFKSIYKLITNLDLEFLLMDDEDYVTLFNNYLYLGEMLGFTLEEIESGYYEKNKINNERQDSGTY